MHMKAILLKFTEVEKLLFQFLLLDNSFKILVLLVV